MPTKDELEAENEQLREELAAVRAGAGGGNIGTGRDRPKPKRPAGDDGKPILSAGEKNDLEQHGVCISPFTGETLNALDEGVTPLTAEGLARAKKERAERKFSEKASGAATPAEGE